MFLRQRTRGGRQRRGGLGTVSTQVGNSLVYSSSPVAQSNLRRPVIGFRIIAPVPVRPVGPAYPVGVTETIQPTWGANPPRWTGGWGVNAPTTGTSLATAQALLQSNPALLTASQWAQLQQAGLVASTVPYSSAGQVPGSSSGIDPATGQTYASELAAAQAGAAAAAVPATGTDIGTMLSTPYAGLPLYLWLAIGGGAFFVFSKKGR